jgi:hypothetical protein
MPLLVWVRIQKILSFLSQVVKGNSLRFVVVILLALLSLSMYMTTMVLPSYHDEFSSMSYSSDPNIPTPKKKARGVFLLKVRNVEHACRTVCTLSHFFNKDAGYPIRIFADEPVSAQQLQVLQNYSGSVDVQVIVDTQRWRQLPPILTHKDRADIEKHCKNMDNPNKATCTDMNVALSYVYMGYWRYMHMGDEPSLRDFDYFVSLDADAFLTQPMPDPFQIMQSNNLTGIFNILAYQSASMGNGIQKATEAVASLEERRNRYLDRRKYNLMDDKGQWTADRTSIWGCFYGGRLDFFRTPRFKKIAETVAYYTYRYRTDEQPVIALAWSLLGDGDKVWYLPMRNITMGIYHHGWIDNKEAVLRSATPPDDHKEDHTKAEGQEYWFHTLDTWHGFREIRDNLMSVKDYTKTNGYTDDYDKCWEAPTK